ncbi:MAG: VWA domain-containing protein [SAR324 cluster bacterium]|nr:VWA domain-containing protein [SAR324 cluster bacterium]
MTGFESFQFLRPGWLVLIIPGCWLVFRLHQRWKQRTDWSGVVEPHLLELLLVEARGIRRTWIPWMLSLMLILVLTAMAGPVLEKRSVPVLKKNLAKVLVLDVSHSMLAEDLRPNRIERAKFKLRDLLNRIDEGETALIAYAGDAHIISPLTSDTHTITTLLPGLEPDIMPHRGSRPDRAMELAVKLLDGHSANPGEVIWLTDGIPENMIPTVAQLLGRHRLSVIGVGTEKGAPIPGKNSGFLKNSKGGIVMSRLDTSRLQVLAQQKGGTFQILRNDDQDLERVLNQPILMNEYLEDETEKQGDIWREEGPWLLLIMLPLAALMFRRGLIFGFLLISLHLPGFLMSERAYAFEWKDLWKNKDQQGQQYFIEGSHSEAAQVFENPEWKGLSHFRSGNLENALEEWKGIDSPRSLFNQGNALAKLGKFDQAIDSYDQVLEREPEHSDARFNRDLLKKLLEEQDKQKQQNQEQDGSGEDQQKSEPQQSENQSERSEEDPSSAESGSDSKNQDMENSGQSEQAQKSDSQNKENSEAQSDKQEQENTDEASLAEENKQEGEEDSKQQQAYIKPRSVSELTEDNPQEQELRQWLQKIPDDPSRLLRNKMYRAHQRNKQIMKTEKESW